MLTGIEYRTPIGPDLRSDKLEPYWSEYFDYESRGSALHEVAQAELLAELERARQQPSPYLDSQQVIQGF